MSANNEPSVEELRRESEQRRRTLAHTVDELRETVSDTASELKARISPKHVKEEIKDYVRESSEQWVDSLKKNARENPLQTVAIGAGLAYPLWGLLRSIPAPIILIGAGLWLSKQSNRQQAANKAADLKDAAIDGATRVTQGATDAGAAVASGAHSLIDKAADVASDVKSTASGIGERFVQHLHDATTTAADSTSETLSTIKEKAVGYSQKSGSAIMDVVEKNPLLVAGVGLAIGAFIAASVPSTNTEQELFGERSDQLKGKAQEVAADSAERVKGIAAAIAGDVAEAAVREGLSSDGIKKAVEGVTAGVKSVAEKGMQAALGGETAAPSENSNWPAKF